MSPGLTMERVYDALRHRLLQAELAPGTRLDPTRLAEDLNASVTPVRDALYRLLGERLVDARSKEGFHVPLQSEATLRDLHAWSLDLLFAALKPAIPQLRVSVEHTPPALVDAEISDQIAALFNTIAAGSGNHEHRHAMADVNARLRAFRLTESGAIPDGETEIGEIAQSWRTGDKVMLRRRLVAYHRRRIRLVPHVSSLMQDIHRL